MNPYVIYLQYNVKRLLEILVSVLAQAWLMLCKEDIDEIAD